MRKFDVAVIGAGPAGSSTAITLARLGYAVILLDRARFPRHKLCGDFLNPINWRVLKDLGVADALDDCARVKISQFSISSASGRKAAGPLPLQEPPDWGLGIRRYWLDDILVKRARQAGVTVAEECNVAALAKDTSGWSIQFRRGQGHEKRRARLLVGADGRNSRVARQLGLDAGPPANSAVGFQMQLKLRAGMEDSVQLHQFPGGYAGVVRLDRDTINLAFTIERSRLRAPASFAELRKHYLDGNPALCDLLLHAEPCCDLRSTWPVYQAARTRYGDDFLLVGDAAQVTEPVSGEGIYFALQSGQLAARRLAAGLQNPASLRSALRRYDSDCRRAFGTRTRLNACLRIVMHRPALLNCALVALKGREKFLSALLERICGGASSRSPATQIM
jgi:geranylgeranyl reductase family protein